MPGAAYEGVKDSEPRPSTLQIAKKRGSYSNLFCNLFDIRDLTENKKRAGEGSLRDDILELLGPRFRRVPLALFSLVKQRCQVAIGGGEG